MRSDDRAVSVTVNYILALSITFLLVTGLFIAGGDFVSDQRETSVRTELQVLGEQVAADISMADRLAQTTTDDETVRVQRSLPSDVSGSTYTINVTNGSEPYLRMTSEDPEVNVRVDFRNDTAIDMTTINGGPIVVNYTAGGTLAIERGEA